MLWGDNWSGTILKNSLPPFVFFTRKPKCSINYLLEHQDLDKMFSLPLSSQDVDQLIELQFSWRLDSWMMKTQTLGHTSGGNGFFYNRGGHGYNTRKVYKHLQGVCEASPLFTWLWSSGNLGKHKFCFGYSSEIGLTQENFLEGRTKF